MSAEIAVQRCYETLSQSRLRIMTRPQLAYCSLVGFLVVVLAAAFTMFGPIEIAHELQTENSYSATSSLGGLEDALFHPACVTGALVSACYPLP